jgi:hypothetical protein
MELKLHNLMSLYAPLHVQVWCLVFFMPLCVILQSSMVFGFSFFVMLIGIYIVRTVFLRFVLQFSETMTFVILSSILLLSIMVVYPLSSTYVVSPGCLDNHNNAYYAHFIVIINKNLIFSRLSFYSYYRELVKQ